MQKEVYRYTLNRLSILYKCDVYMCSVYEYTLGEEWRQKKKKKKQKKNSKTFMISKRNRSLVYEFHSCMPYGVLAF